MENIKIIVLDVDGTLTNSEKKITEKTKNALIEAQKKGILVILASGRSTTGLTHYAKELEMDKYGGLLVSYNGSRVVDFTTNEILFDEPLTSAEVEQILEHIKDFNITAMIDNGTYLYVDNKDGVMVEYEANSNNFQLKEVKNLRNQIDFTANKVLTSGDPEYLQSIFNSMKEPFTGELNCMFTAPFYVEYTADGIDKAKALDSVLSKRGYQQSEIIAFGDGHNDITMLNYAGHAVAMDNAVDDLKAVASFITLSNEDDGIAHALDKFIN